jgi:parallel beta-helix repeat protein
MPHRHVRPPVAVVVGRTHHTGLPGASRVKAVLTTALIAALLVAALLSVLVAFLGSDAADAAPVCDKYATPSGSAQRLVDSLSSGQVGCLRGGTYTARDGSLAMRKAGITLRSAPNERATLNARIFAHESADRVTVSNLTIKGTPGKANVLVRGDYTKWLHNDVTNGHGPSSCFLLGSLDGVPSSGTEIKGNRIHDCGHHGIYASKARDTRIVDNRIYGNAYRGVQLYPNAQGMLVAGNVVSGNDKGIIINEQAANNVIRNNVSANNRTANMNAPPTLDGRGNRFENNCVWMSGGGSGVTNTRLYSSVNNVTANPRYSGSFGSSTLKITNPRCAAKLPAGSLFRP